MFARSPFRRNRGVSGVLKLEGLHTIFPPSSAEPGGGAGRKNPPPRKTEQQRTQERTPVIQPSPKSPVKRAFLGRRGFARPGWKNANTAKGLLGARALTANPFGAGRWTRHRAPQSARRTRKRDRKPRPQRATPKREKALKPWRLWRGRKLEGISFFAANLIAAIESCKTPRSAAKKQLETRKLFARAFSRQGACGKRRQPEQSQRRPREDRNSDFCGQKGAYPPSIDNPGRRWFVGGKPFLPAQGRFPGFPRAGQAAKPLCGARRARTAGRRESRTPDERKSSSGENKKTGRARKPRGVGGRADQDGARAGA